MTKVRFNRVNAGLLFGLLLFACREPNPAYVKRIDAGDGPLREDTQALPGDDAAPETSPEAPSSDGPDAVADVAQERRGDRSPAEAQGEVSAGLDGSDGVRPADVPAEAPPEAGPAEVPRDQARDTDVARDGKDGPLPDAPDDGIQQPDGPGIDTAPLCSEQEQRPCVSPGNPLIGACHEGKQTCHSGAWGECKDEVLPAADDQLCNGIDDDCDGMTDEDCVDACVVVAPGPDAGDADGTAAKPFRSIQAALDFVAASDGGAPRNVCVASAASCTETPAVYPLDAGLTIPAGAHVLGNYALSGTTLVYCGDDQTPPSTTLQLKSASAPVTFTSSGTGPAELGGFSILRYAAGGSTASDTLSAVSVGGGRKVTLSHLFVTDEPAGDKTYGVLVDGGAEATIVHSAITAGQGRTLAAAVYVDGGTVNLRLNCDATSVVDGVCQAGCGAGESVLGLRGRSAASVTGEPGDTSAVFVTTSSSGASSIVANLLCGGRGSGNGDVQGANVAALRCEGNGCRTVASNAIVGGSGDLSVAAAMSNGSGRWDGNLFAGGCAQKRSIGVLLTGAATQLVNNRMLGGDCEGGAAADFAGVRVVSVTGGGEPQLHSNVIDPMGSGGECQSHAVAFERRSGTSVALGILRNNILVAGNCKQRFIIDETADATASIVEHNDFYAGPTSASDATTVLYRRGGNAYTTVDQIDGVLTGVSANLSADPLFVEYPKDFHLSAGSPCIDHGTATSAPATDGDGRSRPQGAGYDIGAFEYVSPTR